MHLLEYDYEMLYKKGSQNLVALSRIEIDMNININSITGTCGDTVHSAGEHMDVIFKYGAPIEFTEVIFQRKLDK